MIREYYNKEEEEEKWNGSIKGNGEGGDGEKGEREVMVGGGEKGVQQQRGGKREVE